MLCSAVHGITVQYSAMEFTDLLGSSVQHSELQFSASPCNLVSPVLPRASYAIKVLSSKIWNISFTVLNSVE